MSYDRTERIRRAAILISSLEESLAEQMLQTLPPREAEKVLAEVDRLGTIDSEEIEDVLHEFRTAGRRGRAASAVEFTYSAPQPAATTQAREPATDVLVKPAAAEAAAAQGDADAALTAELLANEHPQTIAAALSRLGHERGAAVFASLPAALQAEVLDRVASLEPADEDIVAELETQLQRRIDQHRQRRERAAAAAELARRMLEKTAPAQRASLLARLSPADAATPTSAATPAREAMPVALQAQALATAVRRAKSPAPAIESLRAQAAPSESWTDAPMPSGSMVAPPAHDAVLEDRSGELESLSDRALLEALRLADERTVQRALAASSETFLKRVAGKLPRRQAARLRKLVRSLGPTRLAELREAQHELLRIAREEGSEVRGPLSVVRCYTNSNN